MGTTKHDPPRSSSPSGTALPFSTHRRSDNWIAVSGQLGLRAGRLVQGGAAQETAQAMLNLRDVLQAAGASIGSVVKVNVFLTSMADYEDMNDAYIKAFDGHSLPARTAVAVLALPRNATVEIEAWAVASASD